MEFVTRAGVIGLGMLYPGYQSFKAVKREDVPSQKSWLKYWLVLSVVSAVMLVVEPILYPRVPMYNFLKIGVIAYLVLPTTKGYMQVYHAVLLPQLDRHEVAIDSAAADFMKASEHHARNLRPMVNDFANKTRVFVSQRTGQMKQPQQPNMHKRSM